MKKALLIAVAILLMASANNAADLGYVGLYADGNHSVCNVMNPGGFFPFEMWIWWLPTARGLQAAEFMVAYPGIIIGSTVTINPAVTVSLGTLTGGTSVAFGSCNTGWVWTHHQTCYLTATNAAIIEVMPDPTALPPFLGLASCAAGSPTEPVTKLTHLYLNQQCVYATKDATWGAVKSLF